MLNKFYSTEQASKIAEFIGFLLMLFDLNITSDEVQSIVAGAMIVIGIIYGWVKRYKRGDLYISGKRKS